MKDEYLNALRSGLCDQARDIMKNECLTPAELEEVKKRALKKEKQKEVE